MRRVLRIAVLLAALPVICQAASAQSAEQDQALLPDAAEMRRIEAAADRALTYLVQQQQPNGGWPASGGSITGVDALCLLAFLGHGHTPERGPYQHVVGRAVDHILSTQIDTGLFKSPGKGPMYSHALATLAVIEAYGTRPSAEMHQQIQKAIDLIVKTQNDEGGWRYNPVPYDADVSVTICQIMALRSARNAGIEVSKTTIDRAVDELLQSQLLGLIALAEPDATGELDELLRAVLLAEGPDAILRDFAGADLEAGSVLVLDSPWSTGYNDFEVNTQQFPRPAEMFDAIRESGLQLSLWLAPFINKTNVQDMEGIEEQTSTYEEAASKGYLVTDSTGAVALSDWWKGTGGLIDVTDPEAVQWWYDQLDKTKKYHVRAFKADDGEGNFVPDAVFHDGTSARKMTNRYAALYDSIMHRYVTTRMEPDQALSTRAPFLAIW